MNLGTEIETETDGCATTAPAPIALFAYNRPLHTKETVEALRRNLLAAGSDLYVFADGPKAGKTDPRIAEVRAYMRTIEGFNSVRVFERAENAGLAKSIIDGVTRVCSEHGRVIVLEDDLVTSPWFLQYMNEALAKYEQAHRVASIHGYCFPTQQPLPETFFLRGADCWGWATWRRAWKDFEVDGAKLLQTLIDRGLERAFDLDGAYGFTQMLRHQIAGLNDSWAIRWHASCFLQDKLTLYPGRSLVRNIGTDSSGTHSVDTADFTSSLAAAPIRVERIALEPSESGRAAFAQFLRGTRGGRFGRMFGPLIRRLGGRR